MTIGDIGSIAIAILFAAVVLGLGATILEKIKDTQTDGLADFGNQSLTWAGNNTAIAFSAGDRINPGSVILYNNASKVNRGAGAQANYSVTSSAITIINSSPGGASGDDSGSWITSDLNASYTYNFGSAARNATDFGIIGTTTMAEFIPTIAIIAMAAVVIGIILVFFGRRKDEDVV